MNSSKPKPALALLAGLLCDSFVWKDLANELKDEVDIHTFSFAGCTSIGAMADRVAAGMPERFAVVGHSMGGRVALEIVNRMPEGVSHLGLLNTGVHPRSDKEVAGRRKLLDLAAREGMAAVAREWLPPMMSEAGRTNRALMTGLTEMVLRHSVQDFSGEIQALLDRPDASTVLPEVRVPTLLLSGTEDNWSPVSQHRAMQEELPGARLVAVEGAGHMSIAERPGPVAQAVRELLGRESL